MELSPGQLSPVQLDRACGVLVGSAVGDALGAGYEFGSAPYPGWPAMIGGGLGDFAPGQWTDDTAQSVAIALVAADGVDLRSTAALDAIAGHFARWFAGNPPDVGIQTAQVLQLAGPRATAAQMTAAAGAVHARTGRSAGNGSLMRTAPVALAHLDAPRALVEAAVAISSLTHHDRLAGEGAALWSLMIRHAVVHGVFPTAEDVLEPLAQALGGSTVHDWATSLTQAQDQPPATFTANSWVVGALQAAWSAIVHTPETSGTPTPGQPSTSPLAAALATAIGIGQDTDTVAAIAGALVGARWGASAVPSQWLTDLHGWGLPARVSAGAVATGADGLATLARLIVSPRP